MKTLCGAYYSGLQAVVEEAQQWLSLQRPKFSYCSVRKIRRLRCLNLGLESWRIPRGLLVFSLCWNPEGVCSNISKVMLQQQNR